MFKLLRILPVLLIFPSNLLLLLHIVTRIRADLADAWDLSPLDRNSFKNRWKRTTIKHHIVSHSETSSLNSCSIQIKKTGTLCSIQLVSWLMYDCPLYLSEKLVMT